jgi:hypothetical protein
MRILYTILLCCFCLCLPANNLASDRSSVHSAVAVHTTDVTASFLSDVEIFELEDLEDPMPAVTITPYEQLIQDRSSSSADLHFADRCTTDLSDTPRYIRLRHLII